MGGNDLGIFFLKMKGYWEKIHIHEHTHTEALTQVSFHTSSYFYGRINNIN